MRSRATIRDTTAETLAWSRILVLASRRLALESARRSMRRAPSSALAARTERLRREVGTAETACRADLRRAGAPAVSARRRDTVMQLIANAEGAISVHSERAPSLPPNRRFEVCAEVEMLENVIAEWRAVIEPR